MDGTKEAVEKKIDTSTNNHMGQKQKVRHPLSVFGRFDSFLVVYIYQMPCILTGILLSEHNHPWTEQREDKTNSQMHVSESG